MNFFRVVFLKDRGGLKKDDVFFERFFILRIRRQDFRPTDFFLLSHACCHK